MQTLNINWRNNINNLMQNTKFLNFHEDPVSPNIKINKLTLSNVRGNEFHKFSQLLNSQLNVAFSRKNTSVAKIPPVPVNLPLQVPQQQVHQQKHLQIAARSSKTCGHATSKLWQRPSDKLLGIHSQQMTDSSWALDASHHHPYYTITLYSDSVIHIVELWVWPAAHRVRCNLVLKITNKSCKLQSTLHR